MHQSVAREALDGDGALIARTDGIGKGMNVVEGKVLGIGGRGTVDLQALVSADINLASTGLYAQGDNLVREEGAVLRREVFELLQPVGRDKIEAARRGSHPLAVGAVDSNGGDTLIGHQVLSKLAVADGDVAARHRRHLPHPSIGKGLVGIVDYLQPLVGPHPEVTRAVLHQRGDVVGCQTASTIGVDTCHAAHPVVDIYHIFATTEPKVARDTIPYQFVDRWQRSHLRGTEAAPLSARRPLGEGVVTVREECP